MRKLLCAYALVAACLFAVGCQKELAVSLERDSSYATIDPDLVARGLIAETGWPVVEDDAERSVPPTETDGGGLSRLRCSMNREPLVDDIVHYSFEIPVGPGAFDVIGLHRVVKERQPCRPIRTRESIFLIHGASGYFENGFLRPLSSSMAVFLAQNDIDVWGLDRRWSLVPAETSDFTFMQDWGMEKDVGDLDIALSVARCTRLLTGNGWRKMDLLGHSWGATLGYALLSAETQRPPGRRQVKGFIPADFYFKTDSEETRLYACEAAAAAQDDLNNGIYADDHFLLLTLGELARTAPDDPSPVFDWLNNLEAALLVGTSTFMFTPHHSLYHLTAGVFAEGGFPLNPIGLQYTSIDGFIAKLEGFSPFIPTRLGWDNHSTACDEIDVPWDDHLAAITVPVMYVGGAGGAGELGIYTTTLLGSTDVTTLIVQLHPAEEIGLDYGHNDIFMADNAPELVYGPILSWMEDH